MKLGVERMPKVISVDFSDLRKGIASSELQQHLEQMSGKALVEELRVDYPIVFQERTFGRKYEIGLARKVSYEVAFRPVAGSSFPTIRLHSLLAHCFLISAYDDVISGVTWATKLRIRPVRRKEPTLGLSFGSGYRFDKTVDGWVMTALLKRESLLAEEFLQKRGWQLQALTPLGMKAGTP